MANLVDKYYDRLTGRDQMSEEELKRMYQSLAEKHYQDVSSGVDLTSNGFGDDLYAKWFGGGLTTAEKMQNYINISEAQKARDWEETMSNTAYQRGVADMKSAGLNPALMYGSSSSPASTPSAAQATAAPSSSGGFSFQDAVSLLSLPLQLAQMSANVSATRAATHKTQVDAAAQKLEVEFREKTMDARVRSTELANTKDEAIIRQVDASRDQILANVHKTIAETKTEAARTFLVEAQTKLSDAQAGQIAALLPYQQLLISAQTDNQKAQACASFLNAMYTQKMMDKGQIEATIYSLYAHASAAKTSAAASMKQANTAASVAPSQIAANNAASRSANSVAALNDFKQSVFTGNRFSEDADMSSLGSFLNDASAVFSALTTSIAGPLAGILK